MTKERLQLGAAGEQAAALALKKAGYKILARNYKTKCGEIDIIAHDKGTLCFIEVKTRDSDVFGLPVEAVHAEKQKQIAKVALWYLKERRLLEKKARFDVVSVRWSNGLQPKVEIIKNAFELQGQFTY